MIQSQITGSHKALEVRTELSRLRKNNPAIPTLKMKRARVVLILGYFQGIAKILEALCSLSLIGVFLRPPSAARQGSHQTG
jgi:hypothetical protein